MTKENFKEGLIFRFEEDIYIVDEIKTGGMKTTLLSNNNWLLGTRAMIWPFVITNGKEMEMIDKNINPEYYL